MNTMTALAKIQELAEKQGTRSVTFRDESIRILRQLWQSGYEFGREQQ